MTPFTKLKAIPCSLFSSDLYRDVATRWKGTGFSYLFVLVAVMVTPLTLIALYALHQFAFVMQTEGLPNAEHYALAIADQIPPMTWENGKLSVDAEQPYVISITVNGKETPVAIIDTEAGVESMRDNEVPFLLTRDAVHSRQNTQIETRYWDEFERKDYHLDRDSAREITIQALDWVNTHRAGFYAMIGITLWLGVALALMLYRIFQALIYGGVAMIISSFLKLQLSYLIGVRLACVAITPAIIIDAMLLTVVGSGNSLLISIALTVGYLVFALKSNRDMQQAAITS